MSPEAKLAGWFRAQGRRLPWRETHDPYAILVSEVMLQQTQVARVVPRYLAWLECWPTAQALAAASLANVLREWQGLGYNRRALNLHRAAQHIAARGWPEDLTELPGVGRYTAEAVARFALGRDVLPRDVNVNRVLERTRMELGSESAQALMDLGATVCLARVPRCEACPLGAQAALLGVLAVSVGFDPALLETPPPARPRECGDNNDGDDDDDDDPCSGGHLFPFELGFDQVSRALLRESPNSRLGRMIAPA
jgi:A/G-specific adenine glycosylase